jgi:SAM-dependent methyltransferase
MPESRFDCVVCTQTIHLIPDVGVAVAALRRSLKPGGVLLLTVPGISQTVSDDRNPWKDSWRYTALGLAHLLSKDFPARLVDITTYGNVFTAIAFLHGIAAEELAPDELWTTDPAYPVIVAARATAP